MRQFSEQIPLLFLWKQEVYQISIFYGSWILLLQSFNQHEIKIGFVQAQQLRSERESLSEEVTHMLYEAKLLEESLNFCSTKEKK